MINFILTIRIIFAFFSIVHVILFAVLEGFKEAAEKFRIESGIQPSMDLDQLDERIKIRDAIQNGRIQEAISLVNSLHPELLDNDRYLYFHLQVFFFSLSSFNLRSQTNF